MFRVSIVNVAIKLQVKLRINVWPSVALENKTVNSLLPKPREADFGSVNKINNIINNPIKTQRLSKIFISQTNNNYSP